MYAPPAVEFPKTTAAEGSPALDLMYNEHDVGVKGSSGVGGTHTAKQASNLTASLPLCQVTESSPTRVEYATLLSKVRASLHSIPEPRRRVSANHYYQGTSRCFARRLMFEVVEGILIEQAGYGADD